MKILYIDMDGVLVDFDSALPKVSEQDLKDFADRKDEIPGIFAKMSPMPGAIEAFHKLTLRFDTYILSTAPWKNPSAWSDKLTWVQTHLGEAAEKRLIITHHKDLNRGDFLVDDRPHKNGAQNFSGEIIHFRSERFPDWVTVLTYLGAEHLNETEAALKD